MSPKMIPNECSVSERRDHDECFVVDDGRREAEFGVEASADVGPLSVEKFGFSISLFDWESNGWMDGKERKNHEIDLFCRR